VVVNWTASVIVVISCRKSMINGRGVTEILAPSTEDRPSSAAPPPRAGKASPVDQARK
jgi:hypothetical protein